MYHTKFLSPLVIGKTHIARCETGGSSGSDATVPPKVNPIEIHSSNRVINYRESRHYGNVERGYGSEKCTNDNYYNSDDPTYHNSGDYDEVVVDERVGNDERDPTTFRSYTEGDKDTLVEGSVGNGDSKAGERDIISGNFAYQKKVFSKTISLSDRFVPLMSSAELPTSKEIFNSMDVDGSGYVTKAELEKALTRLGKSDRVKQILLKRLFDPNSRTVVGDGGVKRQPSSALRITDTMKHHVTDNFGNTRYTGSAPSLTLSKPLSLEDFDFFYEQRKRELRKCYDMIAREYDEDGRHHQKDLLQDENDMSSSRVSGSPPGNNKGQQPQAGKQIRSSVLRKLLKSMGKTFSDEELRHLKEVLKQHESGDKSHFLSFQEFAQALFFAPDFNPAAIFDAFDRHAYRDDAAGESTLTRELNTEDDTSMDEIFRKLCCGMVAGATSRTVTAPIDRAKMIMQASPNAGGFLTVFTNIYRHGAIYDYYRGNGANCIKIAPETALKFLVFDKLKEVLAHDSDNPTILERFFAGGLAGSIAGTCIYPLEIAKTRLALAPPKKYNGISHCMRKIVLQEGVPALYKGLGASTAGIIPYAAVDLSVNSFLKDYYSILYEEVGEEPSVIVMLICGMLSSSIAMTVTYPANLVRTKLQMQGVSEVFTERVYKKGDHYTANERLPTGAYGVLRHILANQGFTGLYRGIFANALKVIPATSISYTVYGYLDHKFGREH